MQKIMIDDAIAKQLERELRRIKKIGISKAKKIGISKMAKQQMSREKRYKEYTGLKRISRQAREMLRYYTPKSVAGARTITQKQLNRRMTTYSKKYGELTPEKIEHLKYGTPKQVARVFGDIDKKTDIWFVFSKVRLPIVNWETGVPDSIKKEWIRKDGKEFLYKNMEWALYSDPAIDLNFGAMHGVDGADHTLYDYMRLMIPYNSDSILFDPNNTGEMFFVKKDEWENVAELAPDYLTSRKYKPSEVM